MNKILRVKLELWQEYDIHSTILTNTNGQYRVAYTHIMTTTMDVRGERDTQSYFRELTQEEAAWVEKRVEKAIVDTDFSRWKSLPGRDTMTVEIKGDGIMNRGPDTGTPIKKYIALLGDLKKLAQYGIQNTNLSDCRWFSCSGERKSKIKR